MTELIYKGKPFSFNQDSEGFVNLTKLWEYEGRPAHRDPRQWARKEGRKFIEFIAKKESVPIGHILVTSMGRNGYTKAHWQVAVGYAKYLNPELHALVNQIFRERVEEYYDPELAFYRGRQRAVEAYKRQGWSDRDIAERLDQIQTRNNFTDTLKAHGVTENGYGQCTNAVYEGLFSRNTEQMKKALDLPRTANLRENLGRVERGAIQFAEILATDRIEKDDAQGNFQCAQRCGWEAQKVAKLLKDRNAA